MVAHGRASTPFGVYVLDADQPEAELAREIEREVFDEFFANSPKLLEDEYGPYDASSTFLCVLDHQERRPAGMIRIIRPSSSGLKSVHDIERQWERPFAELVGPTGADVDLSGWWDLATLGVAGDYRGAATSGLVAMALYQALNMLADREGVEWAVAILDVLVLDLINTAWMNPFQPVPGTSPVRYLDSPASQPAFCDAAAYKAKLAMFDPPTHEILFEGRGLETLVSTPEWDRGLTDTGTGTGTGTALAS
jgi:hypothetical protein